MTTQDALARTDPVPPPFADPGVAALAGLHHRRHARPARRRYDVVALLVCLAATVFALWLAYDGARTPQTGPIWPQVLATLAVYHTFPLLLLCAWMLRSRRFGR